MFCLAVASPGIRRGYCSLLVALTSTSPATAARSTPAFIYPAPSMTSLAAAYSSAASLPASALNCPATSLVFDAGDEDSSAADSVVFVGKKSTLTGLFDDGSALAKLFGESSLETTSQSVIKAAFESINGKSGSASTFFPLQDGKVRRLGIVALPDKVTRNNHALSVHSLTENLGKVTPNKGNVNVVVATGDDEAVTPGAVGISIAKAFPLFSRKTNGGEANTVNDRSISVSLLNGAYQPIYDEASTAAMAASAVGVRLAARLVDTPPEDLTTTAFADEARAIADTFPSVSYEEIVGDELKEKGYGGIHGVGRAAVCPPRLVTLTYEPESKTDETECVALVGKGIVYDTGGLSIKPKTGMCGMKGDMGGAAGLLGAFFAAVSLGSPHKIILLLCLAENAIGPSAFRNDDILEMYSGKTVEVNNCDAEGRLVLADGVSHATKHIDGLDLVVDMATLTGAQLIATGKKHAGILANTVELETRATQAGLRSGDLCYPLLYAPELLKSEFKSDVADMKNSVKDRSNAQTSCAGHFIEDHLSSEYEGGWLHVDMAGPAAKGDRGTGYGVGLILSLLGAKGF